MLRVGILSGKGRLLFQLWLGSVDVSYLTSVEPEIRSIKE
ncbi:hypothetical protein OLMES_0237 [Oleiphilus messinensis]|uniref:Uncharacterized protein n=1 Tax=Oleiphilus messinensis TaxID=141451 RepID=A0A1Y0I4L1_9GAMM|nr:hypothetical protein OLMES_0237 [Oleiphilus messinensis]